MKRNKSYDKILLGDKMFLFEEKTLTLNDGAKLALNIREVNSKVWIIVLHSLGDHMGTHEYLLRTYSDNFNIVQ